jgi:uncharacterized protein (TIGR03066 family)
MKSLIFGTLNCFTIILTGCSSSDSTATTTPVATSSGKQKKDIVEADGRSNLDKIVGVWQFTKLDGFEFPKDDGKLKKLVVEFTEDGKAKMSSANMNEEGDYKVEGDKLTVTNSREAKSRISTIKSLTTDTLILVQEEDGKSREFELKKK